MTAVLEDEPQGPALCPDCIDVAIALAAAEAEDGQPPLLSADMKLAVGSLEQHICFRKDLCR